LSNGDDQYLTAGQVAERLHVSTKTVHRWAEQGLLSCTYTLGGHRRFRLSDVESAIAHIQERREPGADQPANGRANGSGPAGMGTLPGEEQRPSS